MNDLLFIPSLCLVAFAAYTDAMEGRIPNYIVALLVAFGAYIASLNGWTHWVAFAVVFVATFSLWTMQAGMGGGDVKLLSGIALVLGWAFIPFLAALAFFAFLVLGFKKHLPARWKRGPREMIPLGVAALPAFGAALWIGGAI